METPETPNDRIAADQDRYRAAAHAMQSGVAAEMNLGSQDTEPKHLRVGVNSSLVNSSALATLLVDKGIITREEYYHALATEMEREKARYEFRLSETMGRRIDLA